MPSKRKLARRDFLLGLGDAAQMPGSPLPAPVPRPSFILRNTASGWSKAELCSKAIQIVLTAHTYPGKPVTVISSLKRAAHRIAIARSNYRIHRLLAAD